MKFCRPLRKLFRRIGWWLENAGESRAALLRYVDELDAAATSTHGELDEQKAENAALRRSLAWLDEEHRVLRSRREPHKPETEKLNDHILRLRRDNRDLQARIEALANGLRTAEANNPEIDILNNRITGLQTENHELQARIEALANGLRTAEANNPEIDILNNRITGLQTENHELQARIEALANGRRTAEANNPEIEILNNRITGLQTENHELQARIEALANGRRTAEANNPEIEILNNRITGLQTENHELQARIEALANGSQREEANNPEIDNLNDRIAGLQAENREREAAFEISVRDRQETHRIEIERLNDQIARLRTEHRELQATTEASANGIRETYRTETERLNDQIARLRTENLELHATINAPANGRRREDTYKLEIEDLNNHIARLGTENRKLQATIEASANGMRRQESKNPGTKNLNNTSRLSIENHELKAKMEIAEAQAFSLQSSRKEPSNADVAKLYNELVYAVDDWVENWAGPLEDAQEHLQELVKQDPTSMHGFRELTERHADLKLGVSHPEVIQEILAASIMRFLSENIFSTSLCGSSQSGVKAIEDLAKSMENSMDPKIDTITVRTWRGRAYDALIASPDYLADRQAIVDRLSEELRQLLWFISNDSGDEFDESIRSRIVEPAIRLHEVFNMATSRYYLSTDSRSPSPGRNIGHVMSDPDFISYMLSKDFVDVADKNRKLVLETINQAHNGNAIRERMVVLCSVSPSLMVREIYNQDGFQAAKPLSNENLLVAWGSREEQIGKLQSTIRSGWLYNITQSQ